MAKVFVELTMPNAVDGFSKASFLQEKATKEGCWDYNKKNKNNNKMICVAEYKDEKWIKIGYTVVNRGGTGNALPWGKDASVKIRDFAQTEEICKRKIIEFLNKNYPNGPVVSKDANIENDKHDMENTETKIDTQNSQVKQDTTVKNDLEQHDKNKEEARETVYITEVKWDNEWDSKSASSTHKIDVVVSEDFSVCNQKLIKHAMSSFFAIAKNDETEEERKSLKNFICENIFKPILNKNDNVLRDIITNNELCFANAIADKLKVSRPQDGDVNGAVEKWKNENADLYNALFLSGDLTKIDDCNRDCNDPAYVIQKFGLFELFIGNLKKAKLVILNNNPGADSLYNASNGAKEFSDLLANTLHEVTRNADYGHKRFYPLVDTYYNTISRYFYKKFEPLFGDKRNNCNLAEYIVTAERFGYHSELFAQKERKVLQYFPHHRDIVREQFKKWAELPHSQRPILIIARGVKEWKSLLGESFFENYGENKVFCSTTSTSGTISSNAIVEYSVWNNTKNSDKETKNNIMNKNKETAWRILIEAWNTLVSDKILHLP